MKKEFLKNGYFVYTDDEHRFTLDALILAELCPHFKNCAELCSGTGVIGLSVVDKGEKVHLVELSPLAADLLQRAVDEQCINNATAFCADAREFAKNHSGRYDLVIFNPPYYKLGSGKLPTSANLAAQKFELQGTLKDFILAAKQLLTENGRLLFCIKPQRKKESISLLTDSGLYIEQTLDVFYDKDKPSFLTVFNATAYSVKTTHRDIFLNDENGQTLFYKNLYKFEDK